MGIPLRVLIVEDSPENLKLLLDELQRGDCEVEFKRVDTASAMAVALAGREWDIVIADRALRHFSVSAALELLRQSKPDLPFITLSDSVAEEEVVAAMKAGSNDYIMKGNLKRLLPAIERELKEAKARSARREAEEKIRQSAYSDPLTGLPNRTSLFDRLRLLILEKQFDQESVALLLMDLDHFKEVNDTLGHHRGDGVLQQVGPRLQSVLRPSDIVARPGGDEFAILLPLAPSDDVARIAQKIINALEPTFIIEGFPVAVEASIGIAVYPDHGANPDSLMQRAEVAMYAAKRTGSGFVIYHNVLNQHSPRRLALMGELRQAMEQNQLFLNYQPKIDLKSRRITGVEALVRWQHPQHGLIPPDQFIPPAERTGMIKPLTFWIYEKAQSQCLAWRALGIDLTMSINLSVRNLHDLHFPDQMAELLQCRNREIDWLEMEIAESAIMSDPDRGLEAIRRLRSLGIRFSIDDFGIGYSSLSYLKELPVDTIKIDKSFVINMAKSRNDAVIVRSIIYLAHNLGLDVVAEGVETEPLLDQLASWECDSAQGYYIARPIPVDQLARWLGESPWGLGRNE